MIVIGSTAMKVHFPDFNRVPKDLDIAVETEIKSNNKGIEYLFNPVLFKYSNDVFLNPDMLLSLKVSHLFWDINWEKHMWDVQFLLSKESKLNLDYIKEQIKFWEEYLPKVRRSKLDMSKDDFFNNAINEDSDEHDLLHKKLRETPAYTKLLKDGCDVELDESKWYNLDFQERCDVVYEETAVMAFERYKSELYWKAAFNRQLKDNIIKHFPFFIAIFAIENYKLLSNPKENYQNKLL
jgi:hypothetical protein